eukprot:scaffold5814_cov123-Isochrysis_galbana.AAC.5
MGANGSRETAAKRVKRRTPSCVTGGVGGIGPSSLYGGGAPRQGRNRAFGPRKQAAGWEAVTSAPGGEKRGEARLSEPLKYWSFFNASRATWPKMPSGAIGVRPGRVSEASAARSAPVASPPPPPSALGSAAPM